MTPSDISTVIRKLDYLRGEIQTLKGYALWTKREFLEDEIKRSAAERKLHVAIESCIDIARLLISVNDLRPPRSDEDIFVILESHGIIPARLRKKLMNARGLRNLMVHEYAKIDPKKIFKHLTEDLHDLLDFAQCIATYLTDHS